MINAAVLAFLVGLFGWLVWNIGVVDAFAGVAKCTFWQAYLIAFAILWIRAMFVKGE